MFQQAILTGVNSIRIPPDLLWKIVQEEKGYPRYIAPWAFPFGISSAEHNIFMQGCVGVASCMAGYNAQSILGNGECFDSLQNAQERANQMKVESVCGKCSSPVTIGFTWGRGNSPIANNQGAIVGYTDGGSRPACSRFDFGFYLQEHDCFLHAEDSFNDPRHFGLVSSPSHFHNSPGWKTVYCVLCSGNNPADRYVR